MAAIAEQKLRDQVVANGGVLSMGASELYERFGLPPDEHVSSQTIETLLETVGLSADPPPSQMGLEQTVELRDLRVLPASLTDNQREANIRQAQHPASRRGTIPKPVLIGLVVVGAGVGVTLLLTGGGNRKSTTEFSTSNSDAAINKQIDAQTKASAQAAAPLIAQYEAATSAQQKQAILNELNAVAPAMVNVDSNTGRPQSLNRAAVNDILKPFGLLP